MVRKSTYTISTRLESSTILINSLTGAIDRVSLELARALDSGNLDDDLSNYLIERGHVTRLNPEEEKIRALEAWSQISQMAEQSAAIVICPSVDCNFRCTN